MNHTAHENLLYKQLKQFSNIYPTVLIDIVSEFYPLNISMLDNLPILNWNKISTNQNIQWDNIIFTKFKDKLTSDLLYKNNGFLDSPNLIEILNQNLEYFDLNSVLKNVGTANFYKFFEKFVAFKSNIDPRLIEKNYKINDCPRFVRFANMYIHNKEEKINLHTWSPMYFQQGEEITSHETNDHKYSLNSIILSKIKNSINITENTDSIKCDTIAELINILNNYESIYYKKYNSNELYLTVQEIDYLNEIRLDNKQFIKLVEINEMFFDYFIYNKHLNWDESLFERFSDLDIWYKVGILKGRYLNDLFLIKNTAKLSLTQHLFTNVQWTMPLILAMGWEEKFYRQFEIRSPFYNHDQRERYDDIYIDFDLGNLANDVLINYYPLLYNNYIESELNLDMEVILTNLNLLESLNLQAINKFKEKLSNLIVRTLTPMEINSLLRQNSSSIHSWYKLPRVVKVYCTEYNTVNNYVRSNSSDTNDVKFYPELITGFRDNLIEPLFANFFLTKSKIAKMMSSDTVYIKDAKISDLNFGMIFKNLKYLFLINCNINDCTIAKKSINCLYISRCKINNLNLIHNQEAIEELYFLSNEISSPNIFSEFDKKIDIKTIYFENHNINELNVNFNKINTIGISNFDFNSLIQDIVLVEELSKLESLVVKWSYDFKNLQELQQDIQEHDIFAMNYNAEITSILLNYTPKIQKLILINLCLEPAVINSFVEKGCQVCIFQNYLSTIYEIRHEMPHYKYLDDILYDSKMDLLIEYEFLIQNKRFSDDRHEELIYDEKDDYYDEYADYDEWNFDAYTDGQYGNYYDEDGNSRDIDPEMLGL